MKKLLVALAITASMGASCFQPIGPPPAGEAFGRSCPPDTMWCPEFSAMDHTNGGPVSSSGGDSSPPEED